MAASIALPDVAISSYKLVYFDFEGRAEISRLLFALSGVKYSDERVDSEEWRRLKPSTPLGQLPLLQHNGESCCQSDAISRFLARRFGLYGSNELEALLIDEVLGAVGDVEIGQYLQAVRASTTSERVEFRRRLKKELLPQLVTYLERQLGESPFFVGEHVSVADVAVYDFLGRKVPALIDGWQSGSALIDALIVRVGNMKAIKEYRQQAREFLLQGL